MEGGESEGTVHIRRSLAENIKFRECINAVRCSRLFSVSDVAPEMYEM